jgi:hypothetical protein
MAISDNKQTWYYIRGKEQFLMTNYELVVDYIKNNYTPTSQRELDNLILVLVNEIDNETQLVEHCMRQNLDPKNYMDPELAHYILEGLEKELLGGF